MGSSEAFLTIVITVIVSLAVFMIMRPIYLWYFKINEAIDLLERQTRAIEKMAGYSTSDANLGVRKTKNEWECPKCGEINPNSTFTCGKCEYKLK